MRLEKTVGIRTSFFALLLAIVCMENNRTFAAEVTLDQLNESQIFIQRELTSIDQQKSLSRREVDLKRQSLQSKLNCVKAKINQDAAMQNQAICKQVFQEIANGKLQRSPQEKVQDFMPTIIIAIVIVIVILSKIRM